MQWLYIKCLQITLFALVMLTVAPLLLPWEEQLDVETIMRILAPQIEEDGLSAIDAADILYKYDSTRDML